VKRFKEQMDSGHDADILRCMRLSPMVTLLLSGVCFCATDGYVSHADTKPNATPATGLGEDGYPTNVIKATEQGRSEARQDLDNGLFTVKTIGLPSPEFYTYQRLMSERCGVSLQPVAGCLVSAGLVAYMDGYNEVSVARVKQKFGTNVFDEMWESARERYSQEIEASLKKKPDVTDNPGAASYYRVQIGDTFEKIAKQKKIPIRELMNANPGVDPRKLQINQKLVLPKRPR